ncbi:MAG: TonB-dependent siderophore receptor [Caldimonas sp.]
MAHTNHIIRSPRLSTLTLALVPALLAFTHDALAQAVDTLAPVVVTGKSPPTAGVAGWSDVPLARAPVQATVVDQAQLRDAGATRLSDLVRFDASVSEAYDTEGYVDYFAVRGFVIDNRFNFRRDGLPMNAETSIPLENKARVDILKGASGMQAGTSAPGGLVDVIVKRPLDRVLSSIFVQYRERGSVLGSVDLSRRFGQGDAFGLRVNVAAEHLDPVQRSASGNRNLFAVAGDWRVSDSTVVEAEIEQSHRSQPSVPAFSLLGNRVPEVPDPRVNLNNQPWTQPVVFDATTASLRITQQLAAGWSAVAHGGTQRLHTDDRLAFPFGCTAADGTYYADRYCPDGTFDLYDFRSEGEQRRTSALDLSLRGKFATGAVGHSLSVGVQRSVTRTRLPDQVNNAVGTGNVDGTAVTEADATAAPGSASEFAQRATELYAHDAIALTARTTLWLGARHTRLDRQGARQSFTSPFAALSHAFAPGQIVYASWGRGVESEVAPRLARYVNAGQAVPSAQSRQVEIGVKGSSVHAEWSIAAFDIARPRFDDIGTCMSAPDEPADCTRGLVGTERHRGVEASGAWRSGAWSVQGGAQWLHARNEGLQDAALDGRRPTNVPALSGRLLAGYVVQAVPGLAVQVGATYDSARSVLPDDSVRIPSVTRFDLGGRLEQKIAGVAWTWRAGVDNVLDRRAWREAPYQYSHAYLFPLAPRTFRVSLQAQL